MTDPLNDPTLCEQRVADPEWQADQVRKNDAAIDRYVAWRDEIQIPLVRKTPGTVD